MDEGSMDDNHALKLIVVADGNPKWENSISGQRWVSDFSAFVGDGATIDRGDSTSGFVEPRRWLWGLHFWPTALRGGQNCLDP